MLNLDFFAADAQDLDVDTFRERHGDAFLVVKGAKLTKPFGGPQATSVSMPAFNPVDYIPPVAEIRVVPVRPRDPESARNFLSVGRADKNDVVVPDVSVSIFHAFFRRAPDGGYLLQDADSSNGTFIDDEAVPAQGTGRPVEVKPGVRVRFGTVEFSFMLHLDFIDLVRELTSV